MKGQKRKGKTKMKLFGLFNKKNKKNHWSKPQLNRIIFADCECPSDQSDFAYIDSILSITFDTDCEFKCSKINGCEQNKTVNINNKKNSCRTKLKRKIFLIGKPHDPALNSIEKKEPRLASIDKSSKCRLIFPKKWFSFEKKSFNQNLNSYNKEIGISILETTTAHEEPLALCHLVRRKILLFLGIGEFKLNEDEDKVKIQSDLEPEDEGSIGSQMSVANVDEICINENSMTGTSSCLTQLLSNNTTDISSLSFGAALEEDDGDSFISNDNLLFNIISAKKFKTLCGDKSNRSWEITGKIPSLHH